MLLEVYSSSMKGSADYVIFYLSFLITKQCEYSRFKLTVFRIVKSCAYSKAYVRR